MSVESPDRFHAALGTRERWSTLAAVGLSVLGLTGLGLILMIRSGDVRWVFLGLPFTLLLFVIGRLAPTGYRLAPDGIHVERRAGPRVIPYVTIRAVDRLARPLGGISVAGSRGVFGRFGRFWNSRLGFYRLFVTDSAAVVWLETSEGWVGLSPERPDEFVTRLRTRLTSARR